MDKTVTKAPRIGSEAAADKAKKRDVSPKNNEIRYLYVPYMRQMRDKLRKEYAKNQPQFWIPVDTTLLIQYNFVALMPHSRYIYVAILLHCGATGTDEIPTDSRFLANIFGVDERTVSKSLDELENAKLLTERKKEREEREEKKSTDRQTETADAGVLCVDDLNLFQDISDEENTEAKTEAKAEAEKTENKNGILKIVSSAGSSNGNGKHSIYSIEECLRYVEVCQSKGERVESPKALASHLRKTGEADAFIMTTLYPAQADALDAEKYGEPTKFTDEPCSVCFGAKMADVAGKGFGKCAHCKNERGQSTGKEPEES